MKGIKHIFLRECKNYGLQITIGKLWQCKPDRKELIVPEQKGDLELFIGFHELAHFVLHKNDKRNYDDLLQRIEIEREADDWANAKMRQYGYRQQINDATLGLITLSIYKGNVHKSYSISFDGPRMIVLHRHGMEIFSQFLSNLPMHPTVY